LSRVLQGISKICSSFFLAACGGKREEKRFLGDTPNPGRVDPAPLYGLISAILTPGGSKSEKKRFLGDTPNPGRVDPAPLSTA